jgi:hypothetical protein
MYQAWPGGDYDAGLLQPVQRSPFARGARRPVAPQIMGAKPDQAHGRAEIMHPRRERPDRHVGAALQERIPLARRPQHRPLRGRGSRGRISRGDYPAFEILRVVAWRHE